MNTGPPLEISYLQVWSATRVVPHLKGESVTQGDGHEEEQIL